MIISTKTKMSRLVEYNYHLLGIMSRMGFKGNFFEYSVADACAKHGVDAETFVMLCKVYSLPDFKPTEDQLRRCRISDLLHYLHSSHDYYMNSALETISPSIEDLIAPARPLQQKAVRQFFENYRKELMKHFAFEEDTVIPYVKRLLSGDCTPGFSITLFSENHSNIEESLSDLKNLIMNATPPECDNGKRLDTLSHIFHLQEDLKHHTYIEDCVLVPLVKWLEGKNLSNGESDITEGPEDEHNALSDREQEVLVLVAKGLLNKEIADKLNISINTVITHRKNITRKTGIKTVPGLTVYAILSGLVDINAIE